MAISKKSWTGVAREATPGTAAATPTVYVPCKSKASHKTKYVYVTEDRGGRDANTKRLGTVRMSQLDVSGSWYNDTWVYYLLGFMGGIASSQPAAGTDPSVYLHSLTLVDTPPALTVFKGYDVAGYYYTYSAVEKLTLDFAADGKLLDGTVTLQGQYGTKIGAGAFTGMTPSYSAINLFAGYTPTLTLDAVAATNIEEMKLEFEQKLTLFYAINGTRSYAKLYYGDRSAKVSFTASFDDTSLADKFDTEADQHLTVLFQGNIISNTYHQELGFDFPIVGWDSMDIDVSKEYIQVKGSGTARPGTAVNSTFTAHAQNTVTSYAS